MPEPGDDKKPTPSLRKEVTLSHSYSNLNGTVYDPRYTNYVVGSNASVSMVGVRISNEKGDYLTARTGIFTSWAKGEPYQHASHHYSYTSLVLERHIPLKNNCTLALKEQAAYFSREGNIPADLYANSEIKVKHRDVYAGLSAVFGEHLATNQAYVTAGYKNTHVNLGLYMQPPEGGKTELHPVEGTTRHFRATAQQDVKIDAIQKVKLFGSYEEGALGQKRLGVSYSAELPHSGRWDNVRFQLDASANSSAVNKLGNATARVEIPFALNQHSLHALHGVIATSGGVVSEYKGDDSQLRPVYSIGITTKLFDSRGPAR